jgi:hypothetical protein
MNRLVMLTVLMVLLWAGPGSAGPVILGGDDADDHGFVVGGTNLNGWLYIQRGFENLLPAVGNGNTVALCLGCNGSLAQNAFASGFDLATKPAGWTRETISGAADITTYFAGTHASGRSLANTGLLYFPTDAGNVGGGITSAELAVLNANAAQINTFVAGAGTPAAGGGLFAHDESFQTGGWGWLTALIPGIVVNTCFNGDVSCNDLQLTITPAGIAAFPGLADADVDNATPWHAFFSGNLGGLSVLVTGPGENAPGSPAFTEQPVIIGGGAGTVIGCGQPGQPLCPTSVPQPASLILVGSGLFGFAAIRRWAKG